MLFTAGIWCVTEALRYRSAVRLFAAAVATALGLASPVPSSAEGPVERDAIYVVVPAYNEAAMVGSVVSALRQRYVHVVVVDDGSSDDTASVAAGAGAITLRHCINRGQGAALQTGLRYSLQCGAHCIVTFDADGQHDHRDIETLTRPILTGHVDVALGSRFVGSGSAEGLPWSRRLLLKAAVMFTRVISRARVTDTHNGLRAFSRRAAEQLNLSVDRMGHASEIIDQVSDMGLPYTEVPVHIRYTEYSRLKGQTDMGAVSVLAGYLLGRLRR